MGYEGPPPLIFERLPMLFYILLAVDLILMPIVGYVLYTFVKRINALVEENDALDQGMTEVTDAYESDSLQYEETIEKLHEEITVWRENNSNLVHNAGVDRIARHNQERTIHHLREENSHIRRQLDIAQVVILEHDQNCLPHIVFDKFKVPNTDISLFQDFDIENNKVVFKGTIDRQDLI